jgi:hypothetical protein
MLDTLTAPCPPLARSDNCRGSTTLVRCFYGADFVKGVPQGSYPFSHPSVSLFDLAAVSSPRPTHRVAGARRSGHVWTAPCGQALCWHGDDCGRDAVMCLACWCSHSPRLLALMWFARRVLIKAVGSTPVTAGRFSRLDDRPINIMPLAPPQPGRLTACSSRSGVAIVRRRCGDHRIAKPLIRQPRTPPLDIGGRDGQPRRRHREP